MTLRPQGPAVGLQHQSRQRTRSPALASCSGDYVAGYERMSVGKGSVGRARPRDKKQRMKEKQEEDEKRLTTRCG